MNTLDNVFTKVTESLSIDTIERVAKGESGSEWQRISYPIIIKEFEELAGKHSKKAWVKRLAYTYSWHPQTPSSITPKSMKQSYRSLEKEFLQANLKKVKLLETEEDQKIIRYKKKQQELSDFIIPIGSLIYGKNEMDYQLSSVSKVLHFMFPNLYPLFDRKTCKAIFGSTYQSYSRYFLYLTVLQSYLLKGEHAEYIVELAKKQEVSPLYLMEMAVIG